FRGIFFTSAQQQDQPVQLLRRKLNLPEELPPFSGRSQPYFLSDVFTTLLPRDRGMAFTTETEIRWRKVKKFFGFFTRMFLLIILALLLLRPYLSDRRIVTAVDKKACLLSSQQNLSVQEGLRLVDGCRQVVETLMAQNHQRSWWSSLGFRRSFRLEKELQQQYVTNFKALVLATLDNTIEQTIKNTN